MGAMVYSFLMGNAGFISSTAVLVTITYSPISQKNKRLNFQIATKIEEPQKFKGWVLEN